MNNASYALESFEGLIAERNQCRLDSASMSVDWAIVEAVSESSD